MTTQPTDQLPKRITIALGLSVVVGFGVWFYGYGVLLEPIRNDTGWSETVLSSVYGTSLFGAGILATVVGRWLDRFGSRAVYGLGAIAAVPVYLLVASATDQRWFALAGVVAGSLTGALGYYAAVHTVVARLVPADRRAAAITTNTLWGAFASPVFLPLMAWMVLSWEWRTALRVSGLTVAFVFALVAVIVPSVRGEQGEVPSLRRSIADTGKDPIVRMLLATTFAGGVATSLVILYQVPMMVTAGLSLATASALAGARGFLQLAGRIPMPWLVGRFGSRSTLRVSHLLTGVACLVLPFAATVPVALVFAVVAGVAIGALVPVESIFTADAVPVGSLGVVLGVASLTRGLGAALGPTLGGVLTSVADSRVPALLVTAMIAVAAGIFVPALHRRS